MTDSENNKFSSFYIISTIFLVSTSNTLPLLILSEGDE